MARIDITRTELVWPGKYNDDGTLRETPRVQLPFQVIETVNESRATREAQGSGSQPGLFDVYEGREGDTFEDGWRNKLIWGDNLLVMGSLLEKFAGKVDLIYIDPPFATGADFSFTAPVGESATNTVRKSPSLLEERAYRDTWARGTDSYLAMITPRLVLARDLLKESGALFLHCGVQVSHLLRTFLGELFGHENVIDEVIWSYGTPSGGRAAGNKTVKAHDTIIFSVKRRGEHVYKKQYIPYSEKYVSERFCHIDDDGRRYRTRRRPSGMTRQYLDESPGVPLSTVWSDIRQTYAMHLVKRKEEETGFQTQKPEALLKRILKISTEPDALVADLFCGSGTTVAVAEKLGRRWIGCDLGRWAIHVTRKRLLEIDGCRPFELLNLGKYERQYWQGATFGDASDRPISEQALYEYLGFVLRLYGARPVPGFQQLHGKKGKAMVYVGAVDAPVTIDEVNQALEECARLRQKELHVLGWEWEMGMAGGNDLPAGGLMQHEARARGIDLKMLQIPREVMEQQAVDQGDIRFLELAFLVAEIVPERGQTVRVALRDFVISNSELIPEDVREKVAKWSDWIDYWAVDWDFRRDTFMQGWVTYRTRKDRTLALQSDAHTYEKPGKYTILIKVVDIFGNDTSQALDFKVP